MDDSVVATNTSNTNENPYDAMKAASVTPASSGSDRIPQATDKLVSAGFFQRFLAALIDGILVAVGSSIVSGIFGLLGDAGRTFGSLVTMVLSYVYFVYFISQKGQTLGKQALGIRVQNIETGQNLDVVSAILREVVGKFISSLVLLLGYFWMLWDPKKQTWHDKIAKSVVVKVK